MDSEKKAADGDLSDSGVETPKDASKDLKEEKTPSTAVKRVSWGAIDEY